MTYDYRAASGVYGRAPANAPQTYGYKLPDATDSEESIAGRLIPTLRSIGMQDAGARVAGARRAAMDSDPSLAGYAGLNALLTGQGEVARGLNTASGGLLMDRMRRRGQQADAEKMRQWQEYMARLQHQWQKEMQQSANMASLLGTVAGAGGTLAGGYLGGR